MRNVLLTKVFFVFGLVTVNSIAFGQTTIAPLSWTGSGTTAAGASTFSPLPASTTPGSTIVDISQWNRGASLTTGGASASYASVGWATGGSLAAAQAAGAYVFFTIKNDANTELIVNSISIKGTKNASGPGTIQIQYATGSSGDLAFGAYQNTTTGAATYNFTPGTPIHLCPLQTDTFKVYGYGASSATTGGFTIDNNTSISAGFVSKISTSGTTISAGFGTGPICEGANINLNGASAAGAPGGGFSHTYSWVGPGYTSTNRYGGITAATSSATGIYTFTVTDAWGCSADTAISLTVSPSPAMATISPSPFGGNVICSNDSILLSTTAVAGLTYQWDTGAYYTAVPLPGATSTTYMAHYQGRYRVLVTNSVGCTSLTTPPDSIQVLTAPSAAVTYTGSLGFCSGNSVVFTVPSGAGNSYQWYNGSTSIAGANTNTFTDTGSGNFYVKVSATNGCTVSSSVYVATEVTTPVINAIGRTAVCSGSSVTLSSNISAAATGVTIKWIKNGTDTIVGATTPTYVTAASGDYTCYVSVAGCSATSNDIPVSVHANPTASIFFNGAQFSTYNYFASYQWFLNTVAIPGATNAVVAAYSNGSYRVMVTDTIGCTALSSPYTLNNLSVTNVNENVLVQVYPNPTTGDLHITAPENTTVVLSSVNGQTIKSFLYKAENDISDIPAGMYIISIFDDKKARIYIGKVIKN